MKTLYLYKTLENIRALANKLDLDMYEKPIKQNKIMIAESYYKFVVYEKENIKSFFKKLLIKFRA